MSFYSKQDIFCNACGVKFSEQYPKVIGRDFKVCSTECLNEIQWRNVLSTLGKDYKPQKSNDSKN
jgi:hypothetical protein